MGRTESKSLQVHPRDEQSTIEKMQNFGWTLLNSQDVKTVDNHLERKGNTIYQITEKEHYVKLTFTRELELPSLDKIKKLEEEYDKLIIADEPKLFPKYTLVIAGIGLVIMLSSTGFGLLVVLAGAGAWFYNFSKVYKPLKQIVNKQLIEYPKKKSEILAEVSQYL